VGQGKFLWARKQKITVWAREILAGEGNLVVRENLVANKKKVVVLGEKIFMAFRGNQARVFFIFF
jgi:hypothetical protein